MEKILVVFVLVPIISLITINAWCGLIDWLSRKDPGRYHNQMSDFSSNREGVNYILNILSVFRIKKSP